MSKIKMVAGLVAIVCVCAAYLAPAAMAEVSEFTGVGNEVKATGGETVFTSGETSVVCASSKGLGKVTSAKQLKLEVTYATCEAFFGKEGKSKEVKISVCHFIYSPEDTVAIEKGCVIGAKILGVECSLEPAVGSEKNLKEVLYHQPTNEEGVETELELEIYEGVTGIKYTAVGKACETAGVKGSEAGTLTSTSATQAQGAAVVPVRKIFVEGATLGTPREVRLESTNEQVMKFPRANKTISCGSMVWKGSTGFALASFRLFSTLTTTACKSTILLTGGNPSPATLSFEKCFLVIGVSPGLTLAEQPGEAALINQTEECNFKAKVSNGVNSCTIRIATDTWTGGGLRLKNEGTNPKTVGVKFAASPTTWFRYTPTETCPEVASGEGAHAIFEGASIFRAFVAGVEKSVEVR